MSIEEQLWYIFNDITPGYRVLLTDTFSLLCFLHKQGNKAAAVKLMRDVFTKVNIQRKQSNLSNQEAFLNSVLNSLDGNQKAFGSAVSCGEFTC